MSQPSLLELTQRTELTPEVLVAALFDSGWVHREELARSLGVSVRAVREAAQASRGAILSGQRGLKLTADATESELEECLSVFVSQISAMTERVVQTRDVWNSTRQHEHAIHSLNSDGWRFSPTCACGAVRYFSVADDRWMWVLPSGV